jgi:hypothetical protein
MPALHPEGLTVLAHADHGPRFVAYWGLTPAMAVYFYSLPKSDILPSYAV